MIDQFTEQSDQGPIVTVIRFTETGWPDGIDRSDHRSICNCDECLDWRIRVGLPRDTDEVRRMVRAERARQERSNYGYSRAPRGAIRYVTPPQYITCDDSTDATLNSVHWTPAEDGLYDIATSFEASPSRIIDERMEITEEQMETLRDALERIDREAALRRIEESMRTPEGDDE